MKTIKSLFILLLTCTLVVSAPAYAKNGADDGPGHNVNDDHGHHNGVGNGVGQGGLNADQRACLKDARQDFRDAEQDAKFNLQQQEFVCKFGPVKAACLTGCFQTFKGCIEPVFQSLKACRISCNDAFAAAREAAKTQLGCGDNCRTNIDYQRAVIQAGADFHICNLNCRTTDTVIGERAACRTAYATCRKGC